MTDNQICFQTKHDLFQGYAFDTFRKSSEYIHFKDHSLREVLILADRVLAATREDLEFGRVITLADKLEAIIAAKDASQHHSIPAEDLLKSIELWAKSVLHLINPTRYQQLSAIKIILHLLLCCENWIF